MSAALRSRRMRWRRVLPWAAAALVMGIVAYGAHRVFATEDLVAVAARLRAGDPAAGIEPDPVAALDVLDGLLAERPDDYDGWIEAAKAWQELRSWDNAVDALDHAAACADALSGKVYAMNVASALLMIKGDYDRAVEKGEQVAALYPDQPIRRISIGTTHLAGSDALKREVIQRFVGTVDKRMQDLVVEREVEAYVTDVWSTPDVDRVLDEVIPGVDPVLRESTRDKLVRARERFLAANDALAGYPRHDGFDAVVARAWCQVLLRTGRLYDAHIEAAIALRQPGLPYGIQRDFLDAQAHGAMAVGDHAQAAERYAVLLAAFETAGEDPPALIVWDMYEARVRGGEFEWILAHVDADAEAYGDDPVLRWAEAAALAGLGRRDEARSVLREPFAVVSMGTKTSMSFSLRGWPERRRDVLMLAYELYSEVDDRRATGALDALLGQVPSDKEALRLRADLALAEGRLDAAQVDAFALLTRDARNDADFRRWLDASDRVSLQRSGQPLAQRAWLRVRAALEQAEQEADAGVETFRALGIKPDSREPRLPDALFFQGDPALSYAIVTELIERGEIDRARQELRKLADSYPAVQPFRFLLGKLLVRLGLFEYAVREFQQVLEYRPDDIEALDLATRTYRAMDKPREAAALINRMILDDPVGVGAIFYGHDLLAQDRPDAVGRLVERLAATDGHGERPDVLILAARSKLALGDLAGAQAILGPLATLHPDDLEVALLGLDLGIAAGQPGVVAAAVEGLRPMAHSLLPDQMSAISGRLRAAGFMEEMLTIFDETITGQMGARAVLRDVAAAHKALGDPDAASDLLALLDDGDALLDRFLLLAMQGRESELSHDLRIRPVGDGTTAQVALCLALAEVLDGKPVLLDNHPGRRLRELGLDEALEPHELELLDGLMRILPSLARLHPIVPAGGAEHPETTWPLAGSDVKALLKLGLTDRKLARQVATELLFMVLVRDRPFWEREVRELAEHALMAAPTLAQPRRVLADRALQDGRAEDALGLLQPLIVGRVPRPGDLRLFLDACYEHGRSEWGVATALFLKHDPEALRVLADALAAWNHPAEARDQYRRALEAQPDDLQSLQGLIAVLGTLGDDAGLMEVLEPALAAHPDDEGLAATCGAALARFPRPSPRMVEAMQALFDRWADQPDLGVTLARARGDTDPEARRQVLLSIEARVADGTIPIDTPGLGTVLVRAARLAHAAGEADVAVALCDAAALAEPGLLLAFREHAALDLEAGRLDSARRHLEVLSFVDPDDKASSLQLAQLYFQQLGQPARAAEVVRRTWPGSKPLDAVEILAAESYLAGRAAEALTLFQGVARSPGITPDTYLTVARIAYASGRDDVARALYDRVLEKLAKDDPRRPRALWLRTVRLGDPKSEAQARTQPPEQAHGEQPAQPGPHAPTSPPPAEADTAAVPDGGVAPDGDG